MNFVVTGAARGIGRGLTRSLLTQGHRVFLIDSNQQELENTLKLASNWSSSDDSKFTSALVDLSDRAQLKATIPKISAFCSGRLDVLINNAFATPHVWRNGAKMEDTDSDAVEAEWDTKITVGLTAPFLLARLCTQMLSPGGCIINIASTRAHQSEENHEGYSAAKAGLLGLTQSMAVSLGHRHKIRVNAITPGWVSVDNENRAADSANTKWEDGMSEADHHFHPAGRVGKVEDVAKAVRFLVESDFVTGQEIVLDGGVGKKMIYPEED
ncbi:3-oxoacyl-reductase [Cylindrobasidium torrendii FP15055 ss-10]|uniref:3-oxoacyl-reductase n=1 Tax=Cylindrobasidium torrendii FP15055 ss-10 TaxID=1314674 RepID=A0A0D7BK42_9AGAR|nr:3-oxoacyl-reductase [Cylindrobasidium torrendii FP15055 ss-10]